MAASANQPDERSPVFVFVPTHTTRYLAVVLAGLARQTRRPDHIVVSCDTDDEAIGDVLRQWAPRLGTPVSWLRRPHQGVARLSQVRNNAVRFIVDHLGHTRGRVIQVDGDMLCSETLVERHEALGAVAPLVYPHRIDVSEERSRGIDAERVYRGEERLKPTEEDRRRLRARDRRYRRHLLLRRLGLAPMHKPKLLGGNWSGSLEVWLGINGFDELFQGWGFADDEFARRAALWGARCIPACEAIPSFHLYHPTRQPDAPMTQNPNYRRFARRDLPVVAEHGIRNGIPQPAVQVTTLD